MNKNKFTPTLNNMSFLKEWPYLTKFKNKRTHNQIEACKWGNSVRVVYIGRKYSKKGTISIGKKSRFIKPDEFNRKFYLHDDAI